MVGGDPWKGRSMGAAEHEDAVKQRHLVWGEGGVMSDEEEEEEDEDEDEYGNEGGFGDGMEGGDFGEDGTAIGDVGAGGSGEAGGEGEMGSDKGTKPFVAAIAEMVSEWALGPASWRARRFTITLILFKQAVIKYNLTLVSGNLTKILIHVTFSPHHHVDCGTLPYRWRSRAIPSRPSSRRSSATSWRR